MSQLQKICMDVNNLLKYHNIIENERAKIFTACMLLMMDKEIINTNIIDNFDIKHCLTQTINNIKHNIHLMFQIYINY